MSISHKTYWFLKNLDAPCMSRDLVGGWKEWLATNFYKEGKYLEHRESKIN